MPQKEIKAGLSKANVNALARAIGTATLNRLVPIFSTSVAYEKGQYTNYNNQLYRFTADKSAGAWDSTKVESASLNDLIHDVNAAVASVTGKANTVDLETGRLVPAKAQTAKGLETSLGKLDKTPFAYQSSGGKTDIETGIQETLKLTGATIIKNQYSKPLNSLNWTGSASFNDGVATFQATVQYGSVAQNQPLTLISGHKYLLKAKVKMPSAGYQARLTLGDVSVWYQEGVVINLSNINDTNWNNVATIGTYTRVGSSYQKIILIDMSDSDFQEIQITDIVAIDLTQMFGSNDVVNAIIGNVAGEQVSNLMKFLGGWLPTTYDVGTRVPSKTAYIKSDGYNVWDEEAELGAIANADGTNQSNSQTIRSKNYIRVKPDTEYYFKAPNYNMVYLYGANKEYLGYMSWGYNQRKTIPQNVCWIRFVMSSDYGTTYNHDICFFEYWDGSRIGYEPHEEVIEPMPNVELDGILKVDESGNVYADGDELYSDGVGNKKRYGVVDLGDLTYSKGNTTAEGVYRFEASLGIKRPVNASTKGNGICSKYQIIDGYTSYIGAGYGLAFSANSNSIFINDSAFNSLTAEEVKTALNGVKLVYEKATPTELPTNDFNPNLWADDFGHLQCQDEDHNEIVGLQGVEILYKANVAGFAESLYERTGGEPSDVVIQEDLAGLVAQEDVANKITLSSGITGVYKKAYKTGKVVNLSLILKNETGDALTSLATLFTLDSSLYPANQYIVDYVESNNVLKRFRINPSGEGGVEDALVNNGVVYINISYCL